VTFGERFLTGWRTHSPGGCQDHDVCGIAIVVPPGT
jgi:hypothetical protein